MAELVSMFGPSNVEKPGRPAGAQFPITERARGNGVFSLRQLSVLQHLSNIASHI